MGEEAKLSASFDQTTHWCSRLPSVQAGGEVLTGYISQSTVKDSIGNVVRLTEKSLSNDRRAGLFSLYWLYWRCTHTCSLVLNKLQTLEWISGLSYNHRNFMKSKCVFSSSPRIVPLAVTQQSFISVCFTWFRNFLLSLRMGTQGICSSVHVGYWWNIWSKGGSDVCGITMERNSLPESTNAIAFVPWLWDHWQLLECH